MNNETDLDWLARNVHQWPEGKREVLVCRPRNVDELIWSSVSSDAGWITKDQWLARRAELQGKPSWKDAPEWAEWLAQHSTGYWCWGDGNAKEASNGIWYSPALGKTQWTGMAGEVLGSWRDTLERRPESKTRAQLEVKLVNAVAEVFQPLISIEDNQGQVMTQHEEAKQQNNSWFEHGELPPVGVVVTLNEDINPNEYWEHHVGAELMIVAHDKDFRGSNIAVYSFVDEDGYKEYHGLVARCFRPIRTEREKAVEEMCADISERWANCDELAKHLINKGWVKESK